MKFELSLPLREEAKEGEVFPPPDEEKREQGISAGEETLVSVRITCFKVRASFVWKLRLG